MGKSLPRILIPGRDAGRPSAVGRGGAHLGIAERQRRVPDGRPVQLDLPSRLPPGQALARRRAMRRNVKVIQLDIAPEEIGHNKATDVGD